nr:MAG TPA: hypothetical protein [Caudoviricetes sp.]
MKATLRTNDVYIEVKKKRNGEFALEIYHNIYKDMMIDADLTKEELAQLIKTLTRVHLGLQPY